MNENSFDRQIDAAMQRLDELWKQARALPQPPPLLEEALHEFSVVLEERGDL